jgi:hypothetical protein
MFKKEKACSYSIQYNVLCCLYTLNCLYTNIDNDDAFNDDYRDFDSFILKYINNLKTRMELRKFAKTLFHSIENYSKSFEPKKNILFFYHPFSIRDLQIAKYLFKFRTVYLSEILFLNFKQSSKSEIILSHKYLNSVAIETLVLFLKS